MVRPFDPPHTGMSAAGSKSTIVALLSAHHRPRIRNQGLGQRSSQYFAFGSVQMRQKIQVSIRAKFRGADFIRQPPDLVPLPGGAQQIIRKFAAVAIGHREKNVAAIVRSMQLDLRDTRKLLADRILHPASNRCPAGENRLADKNPDPRPAARRISDSGCSKTRMNPHSMPCCLPRCLR